MNTSEFIDKYGNYKIKQEFSKLKDFTFEEINNIIDDISKNNNTQLSHITSKWFELRLKQYNEFGYYPESCRGSLQKILKTDLEMSNDITRFGELTHQNKKGQDGIRRVHTCYDENNELYICVSLLTKEKKIYTQTNDYLKKTPYMVDGDKVKFSVLKEEYKQENTHGYTNEDGDNFIEDDTELPSKYYWKTPDGWLYLYDKDKPEIISLDIVAPLPNKNILQPIISTEPLINNVVLLFSNSCCKNTNITNLRFGLKDIYNIYETWCKINCKKCLKTQKKFKEEFEKINYKEEKSKGVDVNANPGKRGYNIMVSL